MTVYDKYDQLLKLGLTNVYIFIQVECLNGYVYKIFIQDENFPTT